jgi:NAD(P)-dependent dehydrogenase (short-subunit alcohol dehydrogenase family)
VPRIFITGSTDGLGRAAAGALIGDGHDVVLHARTRERAAALGDLAPDAAGVVTGDLSSVAQTRELARQVNQIGRMDAVIHNAGVYLEPSRGTTADGHTKTLAVNTLAPYLLTALIDRPDRLIYLSSGLHHAGAGSLRDIDWTGRCWNAATAYSESKLHVTALALTLARAWPDVLSSAVDPGWVPTKMGGPYATGDLPTPKAVPVRSLDELFAAAADVGFPAVVKPEFGAEAMGCVRVDGFESLAGVYKLVRAVVTPEYNTIFRAGSDLLLEQYLDGVEFDVDLVLQDCQCVFSSVSQNWPTAEPSFQETGLHLPPDQNPRAVRELVDLSVQTVQSFGFRRGVLHVEGKCTRSGTCMVEVNSRMGGGRIHYMVEAVWGVDLIEAQLRSCLDLPQALKPSGKPRCAVVNSFVYAPATGRLADLPFSHLAPESSLGVELDIFAETGQEVTGPDRTFATVLAELTVSGKNLRHARSLAAQMLREPSRIVPA